MTFITSVVFMSVRRLSTFASGASKPAVVAYLPLRAARAPVANWADPRTLGRVVAYLGAARIRGAFADEMFHDVGRHLGAFVRLTEGQLGIPALLFAAGGLGWLWAARARRPLAAILSLVLVGDAFYSAALNPMAIEDLQCGHPTALVLAIAAGAGIVAAARLQKGLRVFLRDQNPIEPV